MATLYPLQDAFTRGEISPRLHARASLDLYRAALAKCLNFLTLPHGGLRKRGGTRFVGEVKTSSALTYLIPFIFSSEQAYCLEFGNLYLRVYAYGARVGTVEVVTPWTTADLPKLKYYQSADQMWLVHANYEPYILTREAHTTWSLAAAAFKDGPYLPFNETSTTLTPAAHGSSVPTMTGLTAPAGTVTASDGSPDAWKLFDKDVATGIAITGLSGDVVYDLGGPTRTANAYSVTVPSSIGGSAAPVTWKFQGWNGSAWVTLDTREGEDGWHGGQTRYYEFNNKTAFQKYRFDWSAIQDPDALNSALAEIRINQDGDEQTPFNLTASSIVGINDDTGFQTTDVGRSLRLQGGDGRWRWARIVSRVSTTVVTIRLYGHVLPDLSPILTWRMSALEVGNNASAVTIFEERLAIAQRYSVFLSKTFVLDTFTPGEADDDGLEFRNAGGGQANNIVWIADADGSLLLATTGGVRALSGSGIDEALTPSSFKNRSSRTFGCAEIAPINAGPSFLYVTRSRMSIAELTMNQFGRFTSEDVSQISEHIPKQGIRQIAYQTDPDPILWFPLDNGELGGYTHQPAQEVRGMHRHRMGGALSGQSWPFVESVAVTPGQDGMNDDVWLIVRRSIGGATKRYIELLTAPMENGVLADSFAVDCGLSYSGVATGAVTGLSHLNGETVDALADNKVHKGLTVSGGSVTLPGGDTATSIHVGLPFSAEADTLELDVGAKDGSLLGRRKKVAKVILSLLETDTSGLSIRSLQRGAWERVRIPSVVAPDGTVSLFTGNVEVPIDDSWSGMGKIQLTHINPTPCTIRGAMPVFDAEP